MTQCRTHLVDRENLFYCVGEKGHDGPHQTQDGRTFPADILQEKPKEKPTVVGDTRWLEDIEVTLRDAVKGPERKGYSFEKWCIEKMWLLIAALRDAWRERDTALDSFANRTADWNCALHRADRAEKERDLRDDVRGELEHLRVTYSNLREAAEAVWDTIPSTYEVGEQTNRHAIALNALRRALNACVVKDPAR